MAKRGPEAILLKQCLSWLHLRRIFCWRVNGGAALFDGRCGKRFVRFSSMKGVADILGVLPGGRFFAIECKRPGGRVSLVQKEFLRSVETEGGLALVVTNLDDLIAAFATI